MTLQWKIPPPFVHSTAEKLHPWLYMQWKMSRDLWSHILEPGCGLYYDSNDDLAVKVDGTTITCGSTGITASGAVLKSIFDAKGDLIIGTGADAYTRLAVGTDYQVLTGDSSAPQSVVWREPPIQYTLCFASNAAVAVNASSVGLIDQISTTASIKCPTGKTVYVVAAWGSVRAGSTAGTYYVSLILYNKTTATERELATTTVSASTTAFMSQEWTFVAPEITVGAGEEFYLGIKNRTESVAALAAGPHQMFVVVYMA